MLNMEEKIPLKNLCNWQLGFRRIESAGDVIIPPNVTLRIARGEVIAQCQSGNRLFVGTDGIGSHAKIYIDDKDTRIDVGFEDADSKTEQKILSADKVKSLFELKTLSSFKKGVSENVQTQAEKNALAEAIKTLKINDYDRVKFVEEYTGFKIQ